MKWAIWVGQLSILVFGAVGIIKGIHTENALMFGYGSFMFIAYLFTEIVLLKLK